MDPSHKLAPIIIKRRKKVVHGGHHGGAWKVAYADFVTAMMALFIVLWLVNSAEPVKKAVAGYFKDPAGKASQMGNGEAGTGDALHLQQQDLAKLKEKIEEAFKQIPDFKENLKDKVQMTITAEGLRIEFLENDQGLFFQSGSPTPTKVGTELLSTLANELGKISLKILIEGHTDSKPFASETGYTNWELSADRANAARRLMQTSGVRMDQVTQVRGFADQQLRDRANPANASNRRISVVVRAPGQDQLQTAETDGKQAPVEGKPAPAEGKHAAAESKHAAKASSVVPEPLSGAEIAFQPL